MNVVLAKSAGFCFGVKRAVNMVYEEVEKGGVPIYTYGPIIHNDEVVKDFASKGVVLVKDLAELDAAREGLTGENGEQALGRLLLAASAVARLNKWDAEQALTDETDAFIARFKEWEQTGK